MAQWTVHRKKGAPEDDIRLVREGFNVWAFIFPLPWLVIKGMWIVLLIAAAAQMLIWGFGQMLELGDITAFALSLALNLIMGFEGNDLYRWTLARRGLEEVDIVSGDDRTEAEIRYFSRREPEVEAVVEAPSPPSPPPQSRAWRAEESDFLFPGLGRT
jgi:hypothetical protein